MSAAEIAIAFEGVSRVHGEGPTAVRALGPVSLEVARGEFVSFMGPSGSGKSTLLSLAGALDSPSEGRDLAELDARELARLRRRSVGFVFQDLNLLPGLSALENTASPLGLDGVKLGEARTQAREALAAVRKVASPLAGDPQDRPFGFASGFALRNSRTRPRGADACEAPAETELELLQSPLGIVRTIGSDRQGRRSACRTRILTPTDRRPCECRPGAYWPSRHSSCARASPSLAGGQAARSSTRNHRCPR